MATICKPRSGQMAGYYPAQELRHYTNHSKIQSAKHLDGQCLSNLKFNSSIKIHSLIRPLDLCELLDYERNGSLQSWNSTYS